MYIDDSTSRYLSKTIDSIIINFDNEQYSLKCERFDWKNNNEEINRMFSLIKEKNINMFFIDSALYDVALRGERKFLGIWIAYVIRANIPRAHIAIVSSRHSSDTSYARPSFVFLNKISNEIDINHEEILNKYKEVIQNWIEEDIIFEKCCEEFGVIDGSIKTELIDGINLSLARMKSNENLSKNDFKELIGLLETMINNEE